MRLWRRWGLGGGLWGLMGVMLAEEVLVGWGWEWSGGGWRGRRPSVTSKVAKKIALSISREFGTFTCLEGSVAHIMVMEWGWRKRRT